MRAINGYIDTMTIWRPRLSSGASPLYLAIARALEADIAAGRLAPGARLPTHRELADRLGVTVGTVSRAYAESERAGLVRGEVGRGTFVRGRDEREASLHTGHADGAGLVDLSVNLPVAAPLPDLPAALRALARSVDAQALLHYGAPQGVLPDREAGAEVLALHGLAETSPDDVVVCAGSQHGMALALSALARPGDSVAAEELTYPGFLAFARSRGLRVRAVAMDREGIVPEAFEAVCRSQRPKALYLTPTLQNPTTGTLSLRRRERIAEIAARHAVYVVEDDVHRLLAPRAPAPLASLLPERTVYVASLSKVLAPGLRVGYLRVPAALRERIVDEVWSSLWSVARIPCALARGWVRDRTLERVAEGRRAAAAERQRLARARLRGLPMRGAPSAYHVWLPLESTGLSSAEFAARALARGVVVTAAEAFAVGTAAPPAAVRLSISAEPDLRRLAGALDVLRAIATGRSEARPVRL